MEKIGPNGRYGSSAPTVALWRAAKAITAHNAERSWYGVNQADIDRQIKALDEAKQTILALWGRYQARDKLVDELENEIYKLKCSKSV